MRHTEIDVMRGRCMTLVVLGHSIGVLFHLFFLKEVRTESL